MVTTDKNKEKIKNAFSLSHPDILYLAIIIMLGISLYFTASLIQRAADVAENTNHNQKIAIDIVKQIKNITLILEHQHNELIHRNQTTYPMQSIGNLS
jgi:hypothetical protein